ncbi:olfactory receptor 10Q1-like [Macaca mulatta]|uniref:olfactory receptor 10Q1-like n=1 Tax=Macaca mulatta TaxID=9544 RepID=UPI0010A24F2A|nr:olfactory receptor 10Q1-like [Macaca mulatta]
MTWRIAGKTKQKQNLNPVTQFYKAACRMNRLQENHTLSSEFVILGFGDLAELQIFLFGLFLIMHLVTLAGHTTIVLLTLIDSCLQTPMYFFLRNLSTVEICYTLVIVPNMLANFLSRNQRMPFLGCALQMHFFVALGGAECFLLAVMAYDRFVAICKPLHYTLLITRTLCLQMLALACIGSFALSLTLTTLIFLLPFCQSHEINHFFCDIPAVLFLACSDTRANEIAVFLVCTLILLIPFLLILLSYGFIITAVLRIRSAAGRSKAFSTCAGHLLVSLPHYGCAVFIYICPKSCYAPDQDKIVSLIYTNVTPMLYPMIYSLRNKEVKGALGRLPHSHSP